jgi:hypothetical protein
MGRGRALTALNWGSKAAWAVDDGGQGLRRRSGEGLRARREKCVH